MARSTKLENIKNIAIDFLYLDISLTEFSPIIIHHPFIENVFINIKDGNDFKLINLLENKSELLKLQNTIEEKINMQKMYKIFMR